MSPRRDIASLPRRPRLSRKGHSLLCAIGLYFSIPTCKYSEDTAHWRRFSFQPRRSCPLPFFSRRLEKPSNFFRVYVDQRFEQRDGIERKRSRSYRAKLLNIRSIYISERSLSKKLFDALAVIYPRSIASDKYTEYHRIIISAASMPLSNKKRIESKEKGKKKKKRTRKS